MKLKFTMSCLVPFVLYFMMAFVVTEAEAVESVDEKYERFVKNVCENNRTINEEMNKCFQKHSQVVLDITRECINRAQPSVKGSTVDFFDICCKDKSSYIKYYTCMVAYESNAELKKQMQWTPEIMACFEAVEKKYG